MSHMNTKTMTTAVAFGIALVALPSAYAGDVTGLASFTAGTPARAAEVNGNFIAVKTAVDDNFARIAALEARIAALEAKLAAVSVVSVNGHDTVRFSGVNVQVVNGTNATNTVNGTGNLIVGYDEAKANGNETCSIGTDASGARILTATACTAVGGTFALNHKSGSHTLVVGTFHNYSRSAGVVFGFNNQVNGRDASVTGGTGNVASGTRTSVSGGIINTASGQVASVSGGRANLASGTEASVSGGSSNTASGTGASVSGGGANHASGTEASVSGGNNSNASGNNASVSGGLGRSAPAINDWAAGALFQDF